MRTLSLLLFVLLCSGCTVVLPLTVGQHRAPVPAGVVSQGSVPYGAPVEVTLTGQRVYQARWQRAFGQDSLLYVRFTHRVPQQPQGSRLAVETHPLRDVVSVRYAGPGPRPRLGCALMAGMLIDTALIGGFALWLNNALSNIGGGEPDDPYYYR